MATQQSQVKLSNAKTEILAWDSKFLGFPVAKHQAESSIGLERLNTLIHSAKARGVKLLYLQSPNRLPHSWLEKLGAIHVDTKTTFEKAVLEETPVECRQIEKHPISTPTRELNALALQAGRFSRFYRDKNLRKGFFKRLYLEWIRKSCLHQFADEVLTIRNARKKVVAMVTLRKNNLEGQIGLIAVAPDFRGRGLGKTLLKASDHWYQQMNLKSCSVVTQWENEQARHLYLGQGYRVRTIQEFYHFWI